MPSSRVAAPFAAPIVALIVAASLAACGGSSSADPSAPSTADGSTAAGPAATTATPSTAETTTPAAPETTPPAPTDESSPAAPAALTEPPSTQGAEDVARYFMELYPYVLRTGDVAPWSALSDEDCTTCSAVAEGAADPHPTSKQAVDIHSAKATKTAPGSFTVVIDMDETPRIDPDVVHFLVTLTLVHDDDAWLVTSVDPVRQDS